MSEVRYEETPYGFNFGAAEILQHFKIRCIPPKGTHQHTARIFKNSAGKSFIGKSKTNKAAKDEEKLQLLLMPHQPSFPHQGPLQLKVYWDYPYRKSEPKKNRNAPIYCQTRPDGDNLIKGLKDLMTTLGFWEDDARISDERIIRRYTDSPGITIIISQLI